MKPITLLFIFLLLTVQVVSGQGSVVGEEKTKPLTIEAYCFNCEADSVIKLLPSTVKLDKTSHFKLQWAAEKETGEGRLTYFEIIGSGCPPQIHLIWQSKLETLEAAVKTWLAEVKR